MLNPNWIISLGGAIARLQGDAVDSPITEDENYFTVDTAVIYKF
jgi:outer membrane scaffolding protein for murein synthesis (MipA/OmpV family)